LHIPPQTKSIVNIMKYGIQKTTSSGGEEGRIQQFIQKILLFID